MSTTKRTAISFEVSDHDRALIKAIAERAADIDRKFNGDDASDDQHHRMNITACHANGNPLRLEDLLEADDFNFGHDISGIDHHINRNTGKLENHFRPRFSQPMPHAFDEIEAA